ncbi:hypothetical protein E2C01_083560 [Portunus trituberculatus]|uniref:Uncharacterized protein n=1 Tax=Portunus trituberculatus TaxID=210409 RepID=A0A5B7J8C7_PORTR|nr:hypothetical protein [Portunus trituberculatus]
MLMSLIHPHRKDSHYSLRTDCKSPTLSLKAVFRAPNEGGVQQVDRPVLRRRPALRRPSLLNPVQAIFSTPLHRVSSLFAPHRSVLPFSVPSCRTLLRSAPAPPHP